jgi:hypothetical protein
MSLPETEFEWKIPKSSIGIERDRARTSFQAYAAECALHFAEKAHRMDQNSNGAISPLKMMRPASREARLW